MKYVIWYIVLINLYGMILMKYDKSKSQKGEWRVPEAKLFATAALLGSGGILAGMYVFRHKTKHLNFVIGIPLILILQICLLYKLICSAR